ncbi:[citrate (pro-3S)-lyase] ligase [Geomonas sp. RF6]|uniref:[citrate (pro-3S)-lyase] ligase n=1 Tax=Geomonas sp. RF6 TaxID=2897342 RepID=UPI001E2DD3E5|nr:[citrate (pro-3S)-lyase] ligase [Geomonas sp. RF6]UFS71977.1 [citrate (pro-3S)-lyase] ligase [Geomonas sp. RF6]
MVVPILSKTDLEQAKALITASGLSFDPPFDDLVGIFHSGAPEAVGARSGRLLKMLAVRPESQGGSLLAQIVTELVRRGYEHGVDSFFIFTSPAHAPSFQSLNFNLLVTHKKSALMEYGNGLSRYLEEHRHLVNPGNNGAIVANCNPFTRGHRYLVEENARRVDHLYLFVVREEKSLFPFESRIEMVRRGVAELENVTVLETSWYAISSVTFPTYFLKEGDPGHREQMELDLQLFASRIAPFFGVVRRFVGTEPFCATTAAYNAAMHRVLPACGIEVIEVERERAGDLAISASAVRSALLDGELDSLEKLVPESTLGYLLSDEGREVWERRR